MKPAPLAYARPRRREEVDDLLAAYGGRARILAGGQSLIPLLNLRLATPELLIDINALESEPTDPEPGAGSGPEAAGDRLRFGPLVRHAAVEHSPLVARSLPVLVEAMRRVGHPPVRSRGTFAGAIAQADPKSELPAVLCLLQGDVRARGVRGTRRIPAETLFAGPLRTVLEPDEWIDEVALPGMRQGEGAALEEFTRRSADYALCGVAALARDHGDKVEIALSFFSMGDVPARIALPPCEPLPEVVSEQVQAVVDERLDPPDDPHATSAFRRHLGRRLGTRAALRAITAARAPRDADGGSSRDPRKPPKPRNGHTKALAQGGPPASKLSEMAGGLPGLSTGTRRAVAMTVNGAAVTVEVEPRRLLSDVLRGDLGLTGTHVGCEHGACGCCTVLFDGSPARACLILAPQADGHKITTVESLAAADGTLHPLQEAFRRHHGLQCGFCTPGQLMNALTFYRQTACWSDEDIREALSGQLCRCTGYSGIVEAVRAAAAIEAERTTERTSDQMTDLEAERAPEPGGTR